MSEAAMVLWIIGFVVFTLNVGIVCECIEKVAKYKYGIPDLDYKNIKVFELPEDNNVQ